MRIIYLFAFSALALASCKSPTGGSGVKDDGELAPTGEGAAAQATDQGAPADAAAVNAALEQKLAAIGITFDPVSTISVDVENTTAFANKLAFVATAQKSVDLQYFLYGSDFAGSQLGKLLVDKAQAGVKVRLLVDAKTTMKERLFFKTLVAKGNGNFEVTYFRPIPQVIFDDFVKIGIDPKKFAGALTSGDKASLMAQIAASNVMKNNPALAAEVTKLVATISQPGEGDVPSSADIAAAQQVSQSAGGDPAAAMDALMVLKITKLLGAAKQAAASLNLKAKGKDWFDISKWTHHKLLIVDGTKFQGGGRNLEDAYHWEKDHQIRKEDKLEKYVFMDVDYYLDDAKTAAKALETYNQYLDASCYADPPLPASCVSGIPMAKETAASGAEMEKEWEDIVKRAQRRADTANYVRTYEPVHKGIFSSSNGVRVAYAENRMFPGNSNKKLLTEEPSRHNAALAMMIDSVDSGGEVVFQNAYFYLPSQIQVAVTNALKRGVNIVIQSNSPESSDLGYIAQAARLQYKNMLEISANAPGKLRIFEYLTEESLHAKVEIIGDRYMFVGSINADPRCEFLDSNNGVIIDSPEIVGKYKTWLAALRDTLVAKVVPVTRKGKTADSPLLREVDMARIMQEEATPTTDKVTIIHRKFAPIAKKTFEDGPEGDSARNFLQSLFIQY